jgi:hypothetical protein
MLNVLGVNRCLRVTKIATAASNMDIEPMTRAMILLVDTAKILVEEKLRRREGTNAWREHMNTTVQGYSLSLIQMKFSCEKQKLRVGSTWDINIGKVTNLKGQLNIYSALQGATLYYPNFWPQPSYCSYPTMILDALFDKSNGRPLLPVLPGWQERQEREA